jgi:hypothetical protein
VSGGSFELNGILESTKYRSNPSLSKPNLPGVLSYGSNQALSPLYNTSGLVGYWNFDEGSGTIAKDTSGNGNNGTLPSSFWTNGKIGNALLNSTAGTYASITQKSILNPVPVGLSVGAWVNMTNFSSTWQTIIEGSGNLNFGTGYYLGFDPSGNLGLRVGDGYYRIVSVSSSTMPLNNWTHIFGTINSSTINLYINGTLANSLPSNLISVSYEAYPIAIGTLSYGLGSYRLSGSIDDVRVYNRALSASEISALYNATK